MFLIYTKTTVCDLADVDWNCSETYNPDQNIPHLLSYEPKHADFQG